MAMRYMARPEDDHANYEELEQLLPVSFKVLLKFGRLQI